MSTRQTETRQEIFTHTAPLHIPHGITPLQRRIWNALLFHAYEALTTEEEHRISLQDLAKLIGYDSHDMEALKAAAEALVHGMVLQDRHGSPAWGVTALLAQAYIEQETFLYAYSPALRRRLHSPAV